MDSLHNRQRNNVPKTEQSSLLCSNKDVIDCSVLGFKEKEPTMEILLDQFAEILVEAYFNEKRNNN